MQVLQIDTMPDYIERLRKEPNECELLFRELLIGVTHFFSRLACIRRVGDAGHPASHAQ
jgi:chemotaxis methyl-accepting protein methylase